MSELSGDFPPGNQTYCGIASMTLFLALRVRRPDETMRQAMDKVRKRLVYAIEKGELTQIGASGEPGAGLLIVAQVLVWARKKWPDQLLDLPTPQTANAKSGFGVSDTVVTDITHVDLPHCQEALQDAQREIQHLQAELDVARTENERLAPLADKYQQNCEKNRLAARRPRKGV